MKKVNFDSLKNLNAPQSWIDNAINIPQTKTKEKPVLFIRYSRVLAGAACIVLVCALSLIIFLTQDKNIVPIAPDHTPATDPTYSTTAQSTESVSTQAVDPSQQSPTDDTPQSVPQTQDGQSSSNGVNGGAQHETQGQTPTQKPTTDTPAQSPTSKPTQAVPDEPTEPPSDEEPWEPPIVEPTDAPTDLPWEPVYPSEDPGDPPGAPGEGPQYPSNGVPPADADCSGVAKKNSLTGSGQVYVRVKAPDGSYLDGGNLFTERNRATIYKELNGTVYFAYSIKSNYTLPESGRYQCDFYNESMQRLMTSIVYLSK